MLFRSGTQNYTPITHFPTEAEFWDYIAQRYVPIAVENNVNYPVLDAFTFAFPANSLFILGEEQAGLPDSVLQRCTHIVSIPAFGSVRSVNVGTASGVIMGLYRAQYRAIEV